MRGDGGFAGTVARTCAPAAAMIALQQVFWPISAGRFVSGVIIGGLAALSAVGLALVWRANRVVNFAQADLGAAPTTLVILMSQAWGLPYLVTAGVGLVVAALVGALVELLIIRRFARSPRLILTVATIGVTQLLGFAALVLPSAFGRVPTTLRLEQPFDFTWQIGAVVFSANDLLAMIVAPAALAALTVFLRATDTGIAIRAAAERSDRASLLGIPVGRLQTQVWTIASLLSFCAVFLTAGITGLAPGFGGSLSIFLVSLAALVIGRMTELVTVAVTSISLGILSIAIRSNQSDWMVAPILAAVILVALALQRRGGTRADEDETASWTSAAEVRPVSARLASLAAVRVTRVVGLVVLLGLAVWVPTVAGVAVTFKMGSILVLATVTISMVVLSGWAGLVSLGQMAFVGAGAAVAAWGADRAELDPLVCILAAGVVGALAAVVVGLPAIRLRGMYLAVTTLAVALAASSALFSNAAGDWIPLGRFEAKPLLGRVSLDSPLAVYYLALVLLILTILAVRGLRRSRVGRVLVAQRDNERAAASFGISVTRAKLTAFAVSGYIAASAGAVFAFHESSFRQESYEAWDSVSVFVAAVIGGLGSITGAVVGASFMLGAEWILPGYWRLLATSVGVLAVLMVLPDGLASVLFKCRDAWLRWLADRRGIDVPALRGYASSDGADAEAMDDAA